MLLRYLGHQLSNAFMFWLSIILIENSCCSHVVRSDSSCSNVMGNSWCCKTELGADRLRQCDTDTWQLKWMFHFTKDTLRDFNPLCFVRTLTRLRVDTHAAALRRSWVTVKAVGSPLASVLFIIILGFHIFNGCSLAKNYLVRLTLVSYTIYKQLQPHLQCQCHSFPYVTWLYRHIGILRQIVVSRNQARVRPVEQQC